MIIQRGDTQGEIRRRVREQMVAVREGRLRDPESAMEWMLSLLDGLRRNPEDATVFREIMLEVAAKALRAINWIDRSTRKK